MATVDDMLDAVIRREGPYNHLAADRGGATAWGITQSTLSAWLGRTATTDEIKQLTPPAAKAIYRALYYERPRIDILPDPLDDAVFDFAVNSGPHIAIGALQEVLKIERDGIIGPKTLAASIACDTRSTINALSAWRIMMFARICRRDPSQLIFLQGWLRRALEFVR